LPALKKLDEATDRCVSAGRKSNPCGLARQTGDAGLVCGISGVCGGLGFAKYEGAKILFPALAWVFCWRFIRRQIVKQRMRQLALKALEQDMPPPQAG
jgi:hypothetical protein